MLDNVKKVILKNKYAILILLILSLWLRLARGYSIILSYLVLTVLYVVLAICVQLLLEKFLPHLIENEKRQTEKSNSKPINNEVRRVNSRESDKKDNLSEKNEIPRVEQNNIKSNRTSVTREIPRPQGYESQRRTQTYTRLERNDSTRSMPQLKKITPAPKATSVNIKNTGGMSYDVDRKLVRTSTSFDSIKSNSDRYAHDEIQKEKLYAASRKSIVDDSKDLYTNHKKAEEDQDKNTTIDKIDSILEDKENIEDIKIAEVESDYTPVDYDKESEDLKREVESRISSSQHTPRRPARITNRATFSFSEYDVPVKQESVNIPRSSITPTPANVNKNVVLGKSPEEKPVNTRKVHIANIEQGDIEPRDKVDADIDKINKLFDKDGTDEPKKSLFSRFKKKRR